MDKFDQRVNRLVDKKIEEVASMFNYVEDIVPEVDFKPVLDKLKVMHNLLADIKQEVRRTEKTQTAQKPKKEERKLPAGTKPSDLSLEDLRGYADPDAIGDDLPTPWYPGANAWDAFTDTLKTLFTVFNFHVPGDEGWWDDLLDGLEDRLMDGKWITPSDMWYIITHPKDFYEVKPSLLDAIISMFNTEYMWQKQEETYDEVRRRIDQARAEEAKGTDDIQESISGVSDDVGRLADQADNLAQSILTELLTCCATLNGKMDTLRHLIEQGGGEIVKQDTLLVRKKIAELDGLVDELRGELRRVGDLRRDTESWFQEQRASPTY